MNQQVDPSALRVGTLPPAHAKALRELDRALDGEVRTDATTRVLYATDASLYEMVPVGVAMPKSNEDLVRIVEICGEHGLPVTPRTAGTSLAGQAVGPGLVVDTGRYMNQILELDVERRLARVQPGVIRDELNRHLAPHGLVFGPDTSTSNRCMIGGMIGNNSCGAHSILYGTTRDNLRELDVVFADGVMERVGELTREAWGVRARSSDRYGTGLASLEAIVGENIDLIRDAYPREDLIRRNTGYPLDVLGMSWLGGRDANPNMARFLCGTEGTLGMFGSALIELAPAPKLNVVVAAHFETLEESLVATVEAVKHAPAAVELMDKRILDLSKLNTEQDRNRWFVEGDPGGILVIEFYGDTLEQLRDRCHALIDAFRDAGLGYAFPIIEGKKIKSVWDLRTAGLGVLFGKPGDVKPVTLVEDTAVAVEDLPMFIREFAQLMNDYHTECVYYAHASVGELHLRPELNLKVPEDVERAKGIARDTALLVRKYRGALSGEHGDGRLRSPFLKEALGEDVVRLLQQVKGAFDPANLFNPGNIVEPAEMTDNWRFHETYRQVELASEFAYESAGGMQRAVERCNGAGVCRRLATAGGTMCPSYMVTTEERESTRGRANLFRRLIQQGPDALYESMELKDALELCISCKGCKNDCPANVDMATLKAEFEQGWMDRHGASLAAKAFARVTDLLKLPQSLPAGAALTNAIQRTAPFKAMAKSVLGVSPKRALPALAPRSFHALFRRRYVAPENPLGSVLLFVDEFTDRYESEIGWAAVDLLTRGGYRVIAPRIGPSGRTHLSKGFVREARAHIESNLHIISEYLDDVDAVLGIEPSGVLTLVDEALDLPKDASTRALAKRVAERVMLVDAFVAAASSTEAWRGEWKDETRRVLLHGHCHQKALVGTAGTIAALSLPPNYAVTEVPSGCCGMAGSFGYRDEHYETSMAMGELVLFPAVRAAAPDTIIAAPGTSCRHQIHDGAAREALHPVEILRNALKSTEIQRS